MLTRRNTDIFASTAWWNRGTDGFTYDECHGAVEKITTGKIRVVDVAEHVLEKIEENREVHSLLP